MSQNASVTAYVYDTVPPEWTPSSVEASIPRYALTRGRREAVFAWNNRKEDELAVEIRCAARVDGRQCRRALGRLWSTEFGDVLAILSRTGNTSMAKKHKRSLRPDPDDPGHMSEKEFEAEHPILLADVRVAKVWCSTHGEWVLDISEMRRRALHWKRSGRKQTLATAPPLK
jgi:hypothetical protein